jgi:phenylacetate-CoA ligase
MQASSARLERTSDIYGWTCEKVLSPAWETLVRRRSTMTHLDLLEQTQWLLPHQIEALQLEKLRGLLAHARRNIPYYRELFGKIGFDPGDVRSRRDIEGIPILTKDIIRERYADLVDPTRRGLNLKKGTSGSTGAPLKFEYSRESHDWRLATCIRGYRWAGYRVGHPTFYYWAQVHALPPGAQGLKIKLDRALKRETFIDSMKQDERSLKDAVDLLRRTKPHTIVCYTQSCAQLARFILDRGLRDWDDIPVICGAEAVLPADRAALSKAFGPDVFETYGSRETMLMAAECCAHDGMHLSEENLLLEIVKDGEQVANGETGEVIVTDLHNYGMPFIRYANGDIATMGDGKPCSCGRGLRKLDRVDGRRADLLHDGEGNALPGIVFHVLFSDARREVIKQFQAIQHKTGDITLKVVRGQDWDEAAFAAILGRFRQYLRGLTLNVQFCERIAPSPSGKRKTIIVEK